MLQLCNYCCTIKENCFQQQLFNWCGRSLMVPKNGVCRMSILAFAIMIAGRYLLLGTWTLRVLEASGFGTL